MKLPHILLTMLVCLGLASSPAEAQPYPARPLRFIIPVSAGSTPDLIGRVVGDALAEELGQPIIIENKGGGSGLLSATAALAAPSDGYTIWMGTLGILMLNPHVLPSMPFDSLTSFRPIGLIASAPLVLTVNPKTTPVTKLEDLVAMAKAKPDTLTYGSVGAGSTVAIANALLAKAAGIRLTNVSYRGTSEIVRDVVAGEITMGMPDASAIRDMVERGSLLALGVTSPERSSLLPNVPTFRELGYDINISVWYGVYVRSETPDHVVNLLSAKLSKVMAEPAIAARWNNLGLEIGTVFGESFEAYHKAQYKYWNGVLPALNLKEQR